MGLRDLSTRQRCGASAWRHDAPPRKANDGVTLQDHPHEYHFDINKALAEGEPVDASHWWVHLRRRTANPEVKLWARSCCSEVYGNRLWVRIGNNSNLAHAEECAALDVESNAHVSTICKGVGEYIFVEARSQGGWGYMEEGHAILMLPEVRV